MKFAISKENIRKYFSGVIKSEGGVERCKKNETGLEQVKMIKNGQSNPFLGMIKKVFLNIKTAFSCFKY